MAPPKGAVPGGERNEMGAETNDGDSGDQQGTAIVLPPDGRGTDPNRPRTFTYLPDPNGGPGRIIAHDPDAVADDALFSEPPPRRHRKRRRRRRWGVNVRLNALLLPEFRERGDEVGMGGVGMSVRYRPTRRFAVDLGGDFMAGTDSNGLRRQEIPISASGLVYINPRSRVQVYVLGGLHWSFARVQSDVALPHLSEGTSDQYSYIGGQLGAGVEFRVSRLVGIDLDGLAFVRTRTDDARQDDFPEYYDPDTGESSNSSAAGVFRVGATFWW